MENGYCVLVVSLLALSISGVLGTANHKRLMNDLFQKRGYNSAVRPVEQESTTTDVSVWLKLHQIRDLYERSQYLESLVWMQLAWRDEFLTWNESDYGGVNSFHVSSADVWRPDIALYNSVDDQRSAVEVFSETNIMVSSDGAISWLTPAMMKSSCQIDVSSYPFDTQRCQLRFGSWTNDALHVNTTCYHPYASVDHLVPNGEWKVTSAPCAFTQVKYECCANPFSDATYTIVIKRRPMFYIYNLLFPSTCLLVIGILVFFLPPESGEKTSMAITVLLAMTVFMLVIMDNVPPTSEVVPLLARFFGATTGLLSLVTIMSVLVVNVHHRGYQGKPPPAWINKYILGHLARIVRAYRDDPKSAKYASEPYSTRVAQQNSCGKEPCANITDEAEATRLMNAGHRTRTGSGSGSGTWKENQCESPDQAATMAAILLRLEDMKDEKERTRRIIFQWSNVAAVMNKVFFIFFMIITTISMALIFFFEA